MLLALAVILPSLLVGCGVRTVDNGVLEGQVRNSLERNLKVDVEQVTCPSGIGVEIPQSFRCEVRYVDGGKSSAELRVRPGKSPESSDVVLIGLSRKS